MANLRVFVSSTYYDLRHVRHELFKFLNDMGYEPVMHDKGGVPYTQDVSLEQACYNELLLCDIVVCIIGNKYGTDSSVGNFSITMEELQQAIKSKKKVYTFIAKEVYTENKTYEKNISNGSFEPAYADNIKIHEFISGLKFVVKDNPILPFESIDDITNSLRSQFSGLFQHLLAYASSATESKTFYDLQEIAAHIKEQVHLFNEQREQFFIKFDSTIYASNRALSKIRDYLGMSQSSIFIPTKNALMQFMRALNFTDTLDFDPDLVNEKFIFTRIRSDRKEILRVSVELFDKNERIVEVRTANDADKLVNYEVEMLGLGTDDLPF